MSLFEPTADISTLRKRAHLFAQVRAFFREHDIFEVDVPTLGLTGVSDVYLSSLETHLQDATYYLQTSPEYYMKRLLASGSGSIFYLGKSYRADEFGARHSPEFTMLEWYIDGADDQQLMAQIMSLLERVCPNSSFCTVSYGDIFHQITGLNPHIADSSSLAGYAKSHIDVTWFDDDKNTWLDLIFSHCIEPQLSHLLSAEFCFIVDYPACQAALAKVTYDKFGQPVAKRFELFYKGMELANGYWELTDAKEQRRRFDADNDLRGKKGLPMIAADEHLMAALASGLPECAGVALGIDRLLMCLTGKSHIRQVMPFYNM